jgi:hypothetical protein
MFNKRASKVQKKRKVISDQDELQLQKKTKKDHIPKEPEEEQEEQEIQVLLLILFFNLLSNPD